MDLGNTLKKIRKHRGLKQYELAQLCNISVTFLSQLENNKKDATLTTLKKISACLNIPLPVLFFLSMRIDDISPQKKEFYSQLASPFKTFINDFFLDINE